MKKSISLFLSFAIIFTTVFNLYSMSSNASDLPVHFDEACDVLDIAEVIPKELNTYNLEVSRGDFAVFAGHLLNIIEYGEISEQYYYDVPIGHWAGNSINCLTQMGALTPSADKMFRPDDIITYEEACKITLSILGYDAYAQMRGGYPAGYRAVASRLELNEGVTTTGNMTLADTIMLLYNASLTAIADIVSYGESFKYSTGSGKTLLSIYKNIDVITGQLMGNGGTYIKDVFVPQDKVMIDGVLYDYTGENCNDYLGCKVRAYLTDTHAVPKVVYMANDLQYPQMMTVLVNKYYFGYEPSTKKIGVVNEKTAKAKYYPIDDSVVVLKNKQQVTENVSLAFDIKNGSLDMVDIDGDNDYDYILINEYKNYVVGYIDSTNEIIIDKDETQKSIDLTADIDKIVNIVDNDGVKADFSAITVGSVVTVFESDYLIDAVICKKSISGVLKSYSSTDNKGYINDVWYEFTEEVSKNNTILIGTVYVYYLDAYSKVAAIEKGKSDSALFGYITAYSEAEGFFENLKIKIFDELNTMGIYEFSSSVKIDNKVCKTDDEIIAALKQGKASISGQLIVFSLNNEGLLKTIDTVNPSTPKDENTLSVSAPLEERQYLYNSKTFGRTVIADNNTVIFGIPEEKKLKNADDEDFAVLTLSYFTSSKPYTVEAYKISNDNGFEDAIVCYGDVYKKINDETDLFLVDEIMTGLNDEGEVVEIATGYLGGEKKTVTTQYGYSLENDGVASGDIIRLALSFKGEVIDREMIYDYSAKTIPAWAPTYDQSFNTLFNVTCAYPYSNSNGVLKMDYDKDGVYDEVGASANTKIVVYDSSLIVPHARKGNLSDVSDYVSTSKFTDRPVFIRGRYAAYIWMIIYK